MNNLFKAAQITFNESLIDNSTYNKTFDRDGFRQHMLPATESSVARLERVMEPFGFKWEREFTTQKDGVITMYLNLNASPIWVKDALAKLVISSLLTSAIYGSVKTDASFNPSKNQ